MSARFACLMPGLSRHITDFRIRLTRGGDDPPPHAPSLEVASGQQDRRTPGKNAPNLSVLVLETRVDFQIST